MSGFEIVVPEVAVLHWAQQHFGEGVEAAERVERTVWGWRVNAQSRAFLDTGAVEHMLIGGGPFIVDGQTGDVWQTGSSPVERSGTPERPGYAELDDIRSFALWRDGHRRPPFGNVLDVDDPAGADDRVVMWWARQRGMALPFTGPGELGGSDMEVGYLLRPEGERWAVCWWNRGSVHRLASFSSRDDARRMLLAIFARREGFFHALVPRHPLRGVEEFEADHHDALRWDDRDAIFARRRGDWSRAGFAPFVRATLTDIADSFHSADGGPLLRFER